MILDIYLIVSCALSVIGLIFAIPGCPVWEDHKHISYPERVAICLVAPWLAPAIAVVVACIGVWRLVLRPIRRIKQEKAALLLKAEREADRVLRSAGVDI